MSLPHLRTTVIGSYPFPGWLEFACQNLDKFGEADREELIDDAVIGAIHDQLEAGLDVITDGEQTRLDFNLSFYGFLEGIELDLRRRAASDRPLMTSAADIKSSENSARRAGWARFGTSSASSDWRLRFSQPTAVKHQPC